MTLLQSRINEAIEDLLDDDDEDLWDYVKDDEDDDLDILEEPVYLNETFPTTLFISNVPKVGAAKYDRLMGVLTKLFDKHGSAPGKTEKHMPLNKETNETEGFCIVTYETEQHAQNALQALDGFGLDKNHKFKVIKLDTFDKIMARDEEFRPERTLKSFSRADFRLWLNDDKCREQLLLRYQQETEICWFDTMAGQPVLYYGGEREKRKKLIWCDWLVHWSPQGSYLATIHKQGVALWGGTNFEKKVRFAHEAVKNVMYLEFSPNEDFILTWNGSPPTEHDDKAVRIFRVLTGEKVRECRTPAMVPLGGDFPHFLWSHDGKYFAECNEAAIMVRDTETFELLKDAEGKRKTLKYDGLATFQWSPKDNIIAAWILEKNNNPARLVLVEIPTRREIASRSRTQVEAVMHWQSEGDYLCLLVTKLSKTKKKGATNLEIFSIRERNIPVDIVEVKDAVKGFYWETKGHRFAVLTTDDAGHHPKLLLYGLSKGKFQNICSFDLPSNSFNNFFWAPEGQYFVCAAIGHGDLLFGALTPEGKLEILHKDEHFMLTNVSWDPSSRYVMTAVAQPMQNESSGFKYSMEAGFAVWTFQGRLLFRQQKEKLWQVAWRPHPPSLLPSEHQTDIRKNIKKWSRKYDALDDQAKEAFRAAFRKDRDEKTGHFKDILSRLKAYKDDRMEDNGWGWAWEELEESQGWEMSETTHEEELQVSEELIQS